MRFVTTLGFALLLGLIYSCTSEEDNEPAPSASGAEANEVVWELTGNFQSTARGTSQEVMSIKAIKTDASGDVFVYGEFTNSIEFKDDVGSFFLRSIGSSKNKAIFLLKTDSEGNLLWTRYWGSESPDFARDIEITAQGNVVAIGVAANKMSFSNDDLGQMSSNLSNMGGGFVLSINGANGAYNWLREINFSGADMNNLTGLAQDGAGNLYLCGQHTLRQSSYFEKMDASGTSIWSGTISTRALLQDIETDGAGNCYLAGTYRGDGAILKVNDNTLDTLDDKNIGSLKNDNSFVASLDGSGGLRWLKQIDSQSEVGIRKIGVQDDNLVLVGRYSSSSTTFTHPDFDPDTGVYRLFDPSPTWSIFVCSWGKESGTFNWAIPYRPDRLEGIDGLDIRSDGKMVLSSVFGSTLSEGGVNFGELYFDNSGKVGAPVLVLNKEGTYSSALTGHPQMQNLGFAAFHQSDGVLLAGLDRTNDVKFKVIKYKLP